MTFWKAVTAGLKWAGGQRSLLHRLGDGSGAIEIHGDGELRWLTLGRGAIQTKVDLGEPLALPLPYTVGMVAPLLLRDEYTHIAMLGLGGGALLRFYHTLLPHCRFTVVERSSLMVNVARTYFDAPLDDDRVEVIVADAASIAGTTGPRFDLLLVDIFDAKGLPSWVLQPTFCTRYRAMLQPGGIATLNLWLDERADELDALTPLDQTFAGRCLTFHPADSSNLIALGLDPALPWPAQNDLARRAAQLVSIAGIDTLDLLRRVQAAAARGD